MQSTQNSLSWDSNHTFFRTHFLTRCSTLPFSSRIVLTQNRLCPVFLGEKLEPSQRLLRPNQINMVERFWNDNECFNLIVVSIEFFSCQAPEHFSELYPQRGVVIQGFMGICNSLPLQHLSYGQGRIAVSNPSLRTCKILRFMEVPSVCLFLSYGVINFV